MPIADTRRRRAISLRARGEAVITGKSFFGQTPPLLDNPATALQYEGPYFRNAFSSAAQNAEVPYWSSRYEFDETAILPGPTSGTRYIPAFDEGLSRRSFALHLMLIVDVIEELGLDLIEQHKSDAFSDRDAEAITLAMLLMRDEGLVEIG